MAGSLCDHRFILQADACAFIAIYIRKSDQIVETQELFVNKNS